MARQLDFGRVHCAHYTRLPLAEFCIPSPTLTWGNLALAADPWVRCLSATDRLLIARRMIPTWATVNGEGR